MNEERNESSCKVFDGKIVVYGGYNRNGYYNSKSVEAYDHHANKRNFLLDMLFGRCSHSARSMSNKVL